MTKIKLFASYHKETPIVKSDIYQAIQVGHKIANVQLDNVIGDDTGENISDKQPQYNELTTQYWVWKNYEDIGNPNYVGFMHYRRHFLFNNQDLPEANILGCREFEKIDENYELKLGYKPEFINNIVDGYDCIIGEKVDFTRFAEKFENKSNFTSRWAFDANDGLYLKDYDYMLDSVKKHYPDYTNAVNKFDKLTYNYWYNMFIMKKELFFEYQEFLFTVLKDCENNIDISYYNNQGIRLLGYLGERLLTIFMLKKMEDKSFKYKEVPISFLKNLDKKEEIYPSFEENYCALAMSSSNEYVPYLSVCLQSLKQVAKPNNNYDIIIFERSITDKNKDILKRQIECNNIKLRFVNPMDIIGKYNLQFPSCYNLECYFRVASPLILKNYKKIIFTDVDLLFKNDPMELYNEDIEKYPLAACQDFIMGTFINNKNDSSNWEGYVKNVLELQDPYKYFNTGVMLINIEYFNQNELSFKILKNLGETYYRILEQDGLNAYFKNNIKYIDTAWNFPVPNNSHLKSIHLMPQAFCEKYNLDKNNMKIMHFAGVGKPWLDINENMVDAWWEVARCSPYYEKILMNCQKKLEELSIKAKKEYKVNKRKKRKYRILKEITFGKMRVYYQKKYSLYKGLLNG